MFRIGIQPRPDWQQKALEYGFHFHTMYGDTYWDESAYYQFSLKQIEQDIEAPTEELHQMCLDVVERVTKDDELLTLFKIPQQQWQLVQDSWQSKDPSLYSRFDLAYQGNGPAKLFENNADTPTSLYEAGFWQWLWLQDQVDANKLPRSADQFNSLQEKLINRFVEMNKSNHIEPLYFACCKGTIEDRGTVQYLQDCAIEAGLLTDFTYIEDIGIDEFNQFVSLDKTIITNIFKLYPWEFMFNEEYQHLLNNNMTWLEPPWKSILSNKALLPMLWRLFPNHPNLLPAYFDHESHKLSPDSKWVKKPLFSREGANISIGTTDSQLAVSDGPYGSEGFVYQAYHPLPHFSGQYCVIGSWLINDTAAGISIREDSNIITQDMSRFVPHVIV